MTETESADWTGKLWILSSEFIKGLTAVFRLEVGFSETPSSKLGTADDLQIIYWQNRHWLNQPDQLNAIIKIGQTNWTDKTTGQEVEQTGRLDQHWGQVMPRAAATDSPDRGISASCRASVGKPYYLAYGKSTKNYLLF